MSVDSDGLTTAWMQYDAIVFDRPKGLQRPGKSKGTLRLYRNVNRLLFETVEDLEKSGEFSQLLQAVQSEEIAEGFHKKSDRSFWDERGVAMSLPKNPFHPGEMLLEEFRFRIG